MKTPTGSSATSSQREHDFSTISNAEVVKVERLLNARPRKSLGFSSPQEVFHSLAHS